MAEAIEHKTVKIYAMTLKPSAEALNNILSEINMAERSAKEVLTKYALPLTALVVFIGTVGFLLRDKFVAVPVSVEERKIDQELKDLNEAETIVEQVDQLDKDLEAIDQELKQLENF